MAAKRRIPEPASTPDTGPPSASRPELALVPSWVALVVLAVLLFGAGFGGFALRGWVESSSQERIAELDSIELWRKRVVDSPRDAESRLALADALQASGRLRSALAEYDVVLRDDPQNIPALYQRGALLLQLGQPIEAESAFWAVLALDNEHVGAAEALGDYYAERQQFSSLIRAVLPAATAHRSEARLQYQMGLAYENLGDRVRAEERYRLALEAVPDSQEALEGLDRLKNPR